MSPCPAPPADPAPAPAPPAPAPAPPAPDSGMLGGGSGAPPAAPVPTIAAQPPERGESSPRVLALKGGARELPLNRRQLLYIFAFQGLGSAVINGLINAAFSRFTSSGRITLLPLTASALVAQARVATAMESFTLYLGLAGAHIRTAKAQIRVFLSSLVLYLQPRQPGGRTWKSQQ